MANPKTICDELIKILVHANPADSNDAHISGWLKGQPLRSRWPKCPFGWVEWGGGTRDAPVGSRAEVRDVFHIVIAVRNVDAGKAEDGAMEFAAAVEDALDAVPSLGGVVERSYVVNREKQKLFEDDYSVCAVRVTLQTHRRE